MSRNKMINDAVFNRLKIFIPCLCAISILLSFCQPLRAAGTIGETVTTIGLQEDIDNATQRATPKPATTPKPAATPQTNNAEGQQDIAKLEKVAQKLLQSMQSGIFDRGDFSTVWDNVVPKDANFSDSINNLCKPVFARLGNPEKIGQGKMAGPSRAIFPVQCAKGSLNMTVSLDPQEKIIEWTLTPSASPAAEPPSSPGAQEPQPMRQPEPQPNVQGASQDTNMPDINDFNGFQREINRINIETRSEEEQWLGPLDKKVELARVIDELAAAQLRFLRKLAENEHAEQTIKAIDFVLRQRQERLNKLIAKLQDETRQERQQGTERRERRPRTTVGQGQEQTPAERTPRERPQRTRTREPNNVGQPQY